MYIFTGLVASTKNIAASETPIYLLSPSLPPQTLSKRVKEHKIIKAVFKNLVSSSILPFYFISCLIQDNLIKHKKAPK